MTEKFLPGSSIRLPPTMKQTRAITKLLMALQQGEELEHTPANRWEARNLIHKLRIQLQEKNRREKGNA